MLKIHWPHQISRRKRNIREGSSNIVKKGKRKKEKEKQVCVFTCGKNPPHVGVDME